MDAFYHDRYGRGYQREPDAQSGYGFSFAVPVWVIPIGWLDRNLQTEKDDEAAQNVGARLQAIGHQGKRVTYNSG